jgi:HEAT repeat protein
LGLRSAGGQTIEDYLKHVHDADADNRVKALAALKTFPSTGASITALLDALDDSSVGPRLTAIQVLGQLHAEPQRVIPAVKKILDDPNPLIRATAAAALGAFGADAVQSLAKLESLLADADLSVRRGVIQGLSGFAPANVRARQLIAGTLQDKEPYVRRGAVEALSRLGEAADEYLPQFVTALDDPSQQVREAAAEAIGALGTAAAPAMPALVATCRTTQSSYLKSAILTLSKSVSPVALLIGVLRDGQNSDAIRVFAVETLGDLRNLAQAAVPALLDVSRSPSNRLRSAATEALAQIAPERYGAGVVGLPALVAMLGSDNYHTRNRAQDELAKAGAKAIPLLFEVIRSESPESTRVAAVLVLGGIQGSESVALPVLTDLATGGDSLKIQEAAVSALGHVGWSLPKAKVSLVIEALSGALANPKLQEATLLTLGSLREKAAGAIPAIQKTLGLALNSEPRGYTAIVHSLKALGQIGSASQTAIALVLPLVNDPDAQLRAAALNALGAMPVDEAVVAVLKALHDPANWPREEAARAIGSLLYLRRSYRVQVVPALLEHIGDPSDGVRGDIVVALGCSGSSEAVQPVIDALGDPNATVRQRAVSGIGCLIRNPGGADIKQAALPGLIRAAADADPGVALFALAVLRDYGPEAAPALAALRRLLASADSARAEAIARAIKAIEAK